jgi:hypothetical protein
MSSIGAISAAADSDLPFARTKDERLVSDALLLFPRALTVHLPDIRCEWSSIRSPFWQLENLPKMEAAGIITRCISPWSAKTKWVPEPGPPPIRLRMVHQYIPLNSVTVKMNYL